MPPGPKPLARKDAGAEQRRRILRVTADLIAKRGYADTTTELIVRRAKVGYGTFYKFFPDKEEAFLALFDETFEASSKLVGEAYGGEGDPRPWGERVAEAIRAFYEAIAADPPLWRACLVEALTAGPAILARQELAIQQLGAILRPGRGEAPEGIALPQTLERTLAGGIVWFAHQRLIVGEAADELPRILPEAVQFALSPYLGEEAAVVIADRYDEPPVVA